MDKPEDTIAVHAQDATGTPAPEGAGDLILEQRVPEEPAPPPNFRAQAGYYGHISFQTFEGKEILRITREGDVLVNGRKVDTDMEVYNGFRTWLLLAKRENPDGTHTSIIPD